MNTITGIEIKVKANNSKRTYTIRKQGTKYRTYKMNKQEFESAYYWTGNDWSNYLKTDDYYIVK